MGMDGLFGGLRTDVARAFPANAKRCLWRGGVLFHAEDWFWVIG